MPILFRAKNKWALPVSYLASLIPPLYPHTTRGQPINPRLFLTLAVRQLEEAKKFEATPDYQDTVKAYKILLSLVKYITPPLSYPHHAHLSCFSLHYLGSSFRPLASQVPTAKSVSHRSTTSSFFSNSPKYVAYSCCLFLGSCSRS